MTTRNSTCEEEVEDQAPKFELSPEMEYRGARARWSSRTPGVSFFRLEPNFRVPFGHTHNEQEEIYILVNGSARLKLDDEIIELKQWDAVRIPKETMRNLEAVPTARRSSPSARRTRARATRQMSQGWWTD